MGSHTEILKETVEILGRLPDPWWKAFKTRATWFKEDGTPKTGKADSSSIRDQLRFIGADDEPPSSDEGRMIEKTGMKLPENEVELLGDLLEKMLKYRPEERISMDEVVNHPWFKMDD